MTNVGRPRGRGVGALSEIRFCDIVGVVGVGVISVALKGSSEATWGVGSEKGLRGSLGEDRATFSGVMVEADDVENCESREWVDLCVRNG